jgi:hypothetical protein
MYLLHNPDGGGGQRQKAEEPEEAITFGVVCANRRADGPAHPSMADIDSNQPAEANEWSDETYPAQQNV